MSPADLAFVEEVESRIAAVEPLVVLNPSEQREKRLCAMVREQNARIDRLRADESAVCKSYRAEIASLRDKLVDETAQRELVEAERDALRTRLDEMQRASVEVLRHSLEKGKRLAKLETAAKLVLGLLHKSSACEEGCDCINCQCLDALKLQE